MRKGLLRHSKNVHSQNGEDGILAVIMDRLGVDTGWCVEFGAWDGIHLSNTFALVERGWQAVYIEGDAERFKDLQTTAERHPKIHAIEAFVGWEGEAALDRLLARTEIPEEFDLLSVDVDGDDWYVWNGLREYRPKVVVIEINSRIPAGVEQIPGPDVEGASFTSTVALGREKGYTPVVHTGNIIFVRDDLVDRVGVDRELLENPDLMFQDRFITGKIPGLRPAIGRLLGRG
jgi:hypothetical protein